MGGPMAANLAKAGHSVTGFDAAGVKVPGVASARQAGDAVRGHDVVITMLPNGQILSAVYDEIIPHADKGALFIDCSTVDVASALSAHVKCRTNLIESVDAPVSGGIAGAAAGTLTFMAGGSVDGYALALPLFEIMGQKSVHCGNAGSGQAAKICNNMVLGISMIAVCEAFALADKLGLNRQNLFDVMSTSSGSCWSVNNYCPVPGVGPVTPADNDYKPGFAAELMLKDLRLSQAAAEGTQAATPLGAAATALYADFVEKGGAGKDFSGVLPWLATMAREDR
jgi:3-hydroxyisobutyrate dehydrogenase